MKRIFAFVLLFVGLIFSVMAQDTLLPYPIDTVNGTAVYRYVPDKSIGLYRISVTFGLPMGEIVQWNPQLEKRGPQLTDVLLIPVKQHIPASSPKPVPEQSQTLIVQQQPEQPVTPVETSPVVETVTVDAESVTPVSTIERNNHVIRLAVVLPLNAAAVSRDANDDRFFDFYAGVLLAIRHAEKMGQPFIVHTYDVDRADASLHSIQNDSFLVHADAIIGPVYSPQIDAMSRLTQGKCFVLAPFSSSIPSIHENPNLLQFNPTNQMETQLMASYIAQHRDSLHCVILDVPDQDMHTGVRDLYHELLQYEVPVSRVPLHAILNDSLGQYLNATIPNLFIFHKDKFTNLNVLMPKLNAAANDYPLVLLSRYAWKKEHILLPQLLTTVFRPVQDSLSSDMEIYQQDFERYFNHALSSQLPRYDLLGYDLTRHLIVILQQLQDMADPAYREHILTQPFYGIQENIHYHKQEQGGYINQSITIEHL